jgi:hypothetical protein
MTVATSLVGAFSLPAFGLTQSAIDYSRGDGQSVVAADAGHGVQKDNFAELSAAQVARQGFGDLAGVGQAHVGHVAHAVAQMAALPLDVNIPFQTIMARDMPYIGRG